MYFITSFWGLLVEPIDFWQVWKAVAASRGVDIDAVVSVMSEVNVEGYETPMRLVSKILSRRIGVESIELEKDFVERVYDLMKPRRCSTEFVKWVRAVGKFAVLSNTQCRCFLERFFQQIGVRPDAIVASEKILVRKPLKPAFKYALRKLGAKPHDTVYIGDSAEDLGAIGVGMYTVIVGQVGGHVSFGDLCEAWRWLDETLAKD